MVFHLASGGKETKKRRVFISTYLPSLVHNLDWLGRSPLLPHT